ncbi:MAG: glycerol-3-phosphate dehydrogenase/oxidase [Porticoccaceae bacterium]
MSPESTGSTSQYDIVVVGGGIQGAGVAQAAAAAGHSVLLIERSAWGAGTSSKSSKLIHGGLRYLQSGALGLVRESLRERATLLRIAPHLVERAEFHIPVYRESRYRPWHLYLGLTLYWALAGFGRESAFSALPVARSAEFPGLRRSGLQALFRYGDARADDRRLTEAVVASAASLGATLACPATMQRAERVNAGWELEILKGRERLRVHTAILINCAGPWVDKVAASVHPAPPRPAFDLVQGAHLVLSNPVADRCYYLESPGDGRAVFFLPWQGKSLLGTTETLFHGNPDDAQATPAEEAYLLAVLRHYFPAAEPVVTERMAGLRVLPRGPATIFKRSREAVLVADSPQRPSYIAVYGGKLTGYRATAAKVLRLIGAAIPQRRARADTARLVLPELG